MSHSYFLRQLVVRSYLLITVAGLLCALTGIRSQADNEWNDDLRVLGERQDGTWETIDLAPYFPYGFSEANIRMQLRSFSADPALHHRKFEDLASQLLTLEKQKGNAYLALRLESEIWPKSPEGFGALRHDPFVRRSFLVEVRE